MLTPPDVTHIHRFGGTYLGTSRGPQSPKDMVDTLVREKVSSKKRKRNDKRMQCLTISLLSVLFAIGGDGTQKGAYAIAQEVKARGLSISIIGIPKT